MAYRKQSNLNLGTALCFALASFAACGPSATPTPATTAAPANAAAPTDGATSTDGATPTAESILARYVEVTGGADAYRAIKTQRMEAKFLVPAQGIGGPLTQVSAGKMARLTIEIQGLGKIEQGTDGTTVWETNPMTGARVLVGAERAHLLRAFDPLAAVEWQRYYKSATVTGSEAVEGKKTNVVELVDNEGTTETRYYEHETGFLVLSKQTIKGQGGDTPAESRFYDYTKMGNFVAPARMEQKTSALTFTATTVSLETNGLVAAETFALPAEIQAIVGTK